MSKKLTRDDFTVEREELKYGPCLIVSHKDREYPKYVLKSDEKMDKSGFKSKVRHGFYLSVCSYGDWRKSTDYKGLYETTDEEVVLDDLIHDLNENTLIDEMDLEISPLICLLTSELEELGQCFVSFRRRNITGHLENVEISFKALHNRLTELMEANNIE